MQVKLKKVCENDKFAVVKYDKIFTKDFQPRW